MHLLKKKDKTIAPTISCHSQESLGKLSVSADQCTYIVCMLARASLLANQLSAHRITAVSVHNVNVECIETQKRK